VPARDRVVVVLRGLPDRGREVDAQDLLRAADEERAAAVPRGDRRGLLVRQAAILQLNPSVSKCEIFFIPDFRLIKFVQVSIVLLPIDVNKPKPVTTIRFID
jgi:hypothetical protein